MDSTQHYPEGSPTYNPQTPEDGRPPIPATVDHAAFLVAIRPLLDLLNVTDAETYTDLHITGGSGAGLAISFNVTEPSAHMPSTLRYGENGELSVHLVVKVV